MKDLKTIIDGTVHQYVKKPLSERACNSCSLGIYCRGLHSPPHLCRLFDTTGKCKPTGVYGKFVVTNNKTEQT